MTETENFVLKIYIIIFWVYKLYILLIIQYLHIAQKIK